jgi:hypothetical protein
VNAMVVCHVGLAILLGIGRADGTEIGDLIFAQIIDPLTGQGLCP